MIGVHARNEIGFFSKTRISSRRNAHFYDPGAPTSVSKIASRVPKGLKRGSMKAGFPIGNPKHAHKSKVFTRFFSKGHFEMILTTTLLFMTDDKPFVSKMNAHFYGSKL